MHFAIQPRQQIPPTHAVERNQGRGVADDNHSRPRAFRLAMSCASSARL
jgi:hypothetical protein